MNFSPISGKWLPLAALLLALVACGERAQHSETQQATSETAQTEDLDRIAESYVHLVLEMGNHDGHYVDAYYGPGEWKEQAAASRAGAAELAERARALMQQLPADITPAGDLQTLRAHYLKTQLRALAAHADSLATPDAGKASGNFQRDAELLYDTNPPQQDLAEFEPVLAELEQLLPGEEPLHLRVQEFRKQFEVPEDKMRAVFDAAIDACRERTGRYMELPANENFELEFVKDKPWSGYNWYQGKAHSLIQINTGLPVTIDRAVDLGCHEGYPGHHTYNALLEEEFVNKRGWVEYSVYPLFSPQSLIAEGTANYGIELAFPGEEKTEFEKTVLYPLAGLNPQDAEKYARVQELIARLSFSGNEVARQYLDGEIDGEQVVELFQKYSVMSPERARQRLSFVDNYGAYVINYNWGKKLVADYVESGTDSEKERWQKFGKLLSSPRLPSSLDW